jgi:hypothetical protein
VPGGSWTSTALIGLVVFCSGCLAPLAEKDPYRAPIFVEPPRGALLVVEASLDAAGDVRRGSFETAKFQGYRLFTGRYTSVDLGLRALSGKADPVLIVYGPRMDGDLWGAAIKVDDDGGVALNSRIRGMQFPALGEYLVVVTSRVPAEGEYEIAVGCRTGCDNLLRCSDEECPGAGECERGYRNDARGCPTCECMDECRASEQCDPGYVCEQGRCLGDQSP